MLLKVAVGVHIQGILLEAYLILQQALSHISCCWFFFFFLFQTLSQKFWKTTKMAVSVLVIQGAPMKSLLCDRRFIETGDTPMNKNLCWGDDVEAGVEML